MTQKQTVCKYGCPPYTVAVIHGGPGAPGEMAPVAQELSSAQGILEPLQTAFSVTGQAEELKNQLEQYATLPVILIGHSWGALLSIMLAAHYPALVKKLILIGCPPLEAACAKNIMPTRLDRLTEQDREMVSQLFDTLNDLEITEAEKITYFAKIASLFYKSDSYAPFNDATAQPIPVDAGMYETVWNEVAKMRQKGEFVRLAKIITCPITIIHGDYDPHPIDGVRRLLEKQDNVNFIILPKCGHTPWIEKYARDDFYRILRNILRKNSLGVQQ